MSSIVAALRERLLTWLVPSRVASGATSFEAFCHERYDSHARAIAFVIPGVALAWWPADLLVLRRLPEAMGPYARWRIIVAAICAVFLLLPRTPLVRRHVRWIFLALLATGVALTAEAQGPLGGLDRPWFHLLYVVPFGTLLLPLRLTARVAAPSRCRSRRSSASCCHTRSTSTRRSCCGRWRSSPA
jgi:hypothetical protein